MELITYADRLGGDLSGLRRVLDGPLAGLFGGVHVLPFFRPYDGADAGFDPADHTEVDERLGTWSDISALSATYAIMVDVIVNHVSSSSPQFQDWLAGGAGSEFDGMFLTLGGVFPGGAREDDLLRLYRPRPGLPFTVYTLADGTKRRSGPPSRPRRSTSTSTTRPPAPTCCGCSTGWPSPRSPGSGSTPSDTRSRPAARHRS